MTDELTSLVNGGIGATRVAKCREEDGSLCRWFLKSFLLVTFLTVVTMALAWSIFVVPPGMMGIVVTFGHVRAYSNGLHVRAPFVSQLEIFTAKTQKLEEQNTTPTKEGLSVQLDTVVLFRLEESKVEMLYTEVGPNYIETLLQPEANSAVRCYTSESEAKDLYAAGRRDIQDELKANLLAKLEPRGIIVEDVLLKDLKLPDLLAKSIELKLETEQEAKQMVFVLEKERFVRWIHFDWVLFILIVWWSSIYLTLATSHFCIISHFSQEAERKAIEAQGIAAFQSIVSEGISSKLLQWKGIEATEKLAMSPNAKLVVMGNDGNGLPVLLSAGMVEDNGGNGGQGMIAPTDNNGAGAAGELVNGSDPEA